MGKKKSIHCPHCESEKVSKFGYSGEGKQRYLCNNIDCSRRTFILDYTYNGCKNEIKEKIIHLIEMGHTIRDISRKLAVSTNTVITEKREQQSA